MFNQQWNIQKRSTCCMNCERSFDDEEQLHCLLQFQNALPLRKDFCLNCWEPHRDSKDSPFPYWQTRFKVFKPEEKVEPVKKDQVEILLKKYISSDNPEHINLCYILAVMLERKKMFIHKDSISDPNGKKILIYEHNKTAETYMVQDPQLKLSQISKVQKQVKALLDEELTPNKTV